MKKVLVIGGGAAGIMAAISAAADKNEVILFEKNEKLGKKLYITGKGRCNITNAGDEEDFFEHIVSNPRFMYSSFYGFTNKDMMSFLENDGLKLKIERGGRVFPESDKSSDVIRTLENALNSSGVDIKLNTEIESIIIEKDEASGCDRCSGVILSGGKRISSDAVIVATGGLSYPATGSTGDGYNIAAKAGMKLKAASPALVPLVSDDVWIKELQGLSLKNVEINIYNSKKKLYSEFGEMLFTHFGVSGPCILSASSYIGRYLQKEKLLLSIDLKPALSVEQLDKRILKDFDEAKNRQFKNALDKLLPQKLIPIVIAKSGISPDKRVNEISKEERSNLVSAVKDFKVSICGFRDFKEAIITQGGVDVKEINPSTMESKKVKGLFFEGEVLDIDAVTGGYNLQIAWSTGYAAGKGVNDEL